MEIYVVQEGDTLAAIAARYGISLQRLLTDNGLSAGVPLVVGQALLILKPATVYTVQPGDTLTSVADRFRTTPMVLLQNNPYLIRAEPVLRAGETITIAFEGGKRREITANAYAYPYIDRAVLRRALPCLTYLTIFGYGFTTQGELIGMDDDPLIRLAYSFQTAPVMLLSSVTEDGNFSSEKATLLFNDPVLQDKVLDRIITVMWEKGYVGLDIDFEYVEEKDGEAFLGFLENAATRLHANGFFLHTDLAPKTSASQAGLLYEGHDYAAIGAISDRVLLMTYEWGYTYGPPMAVAPINRVREVVQYGVSEIPTSRILLGIPNYGYDWPLPFEKGKTRATSIGNEYAVDIARRYGVPILFDETAQTPFFDYENEEGKHVVWFEDVRSIQAKCQLMESFDLRGVGYWNAMRPFAANWALLSALYDIRKSVSAP